MLRSIRKMLMLRFTPYKSQGNARTRSAAACMVFMALFAVSALPAKSQAIPSPRETHWIPPLDIRGQFQLQGVASHCSTGGYNPDVNGRAYDGASVAPDVYPID